MTKGLTLGADFITDVLLISFSVDPPITLEPGLLATNVALRTLSEALTKAACEVLELESQELQAEFRPALTAAGRAGREAEIYIYDTLPGGAGFSRRVGALAERVFERTRELLLRCPDDCDRSCYRCLRSYKNKFDHVLLDRSLGAALLNYSMTGHPPILGAERLRASTDRLFADLERQGLTGVELSRAHVMNVEGIGKVTAPIHVTLRDKSKFVVAIHSPLTPDHASDPGLDELKEFCPSIPVVLIDEIVVRQHLPRATSEVLARVGYD